MSTIENGHLFPSDVLSYSLLTSIKDKFVGYAASNAFVPAPDEEVEGAEYGNLAHEIRVSSFSLLLQRNY